MGHDRGALVPPNGKCTLIDQVELPSQHLGRPYEILLPLPRGPCQGRIRNVRRVSDARALFFGIDLLVKIRDSHVNVCQKRLCLTAPIAQAQLVGMRVKGEGGR